MTYKLSNHPLYYKKHEKSLLQSYIRVSDNKPMIDYSVSNRQELDTYKLLKKNGVFKKFIENKIVVDAGSGLGKSLPLISFFNPTKIISVEQDKIFFDEQKNFSQCIFPFLPHKKITQPIEFYNEYMESWIQKNIFFETIIFFEIWHHTKFDEIMKDRNVNIVIFTRKGIFLDIYEYLEKLKFKVINIIDCKQIPNNFNNYFYIFAEKK